MSVLPKIAFFRGIRDEIPNQELARELAMANDTKGVKEIAEHLWDKNENVCSDCVKVLYETGYIQPELIVPYCAEFLKLLMSKQNRLVWGAMIALSTIAPFQAAELFEKRELIIKIVDQGSVITQDNGIKTLSLVAAVNERYQKVLSPYLLQFLGKCRISDTPRYAETILPCVNGFNQDEYLEILHKRLPELTSSQSARVKKILRKFA